MRAEIFQHGFHTQLAGHLARCLAAHAVADNENTAIVVVAEVVFVVGADTADVCFASDLN
jgi:hypothetical protein